MYIQETISENHTTLQQVARAVGIVGDQMGQDIVYRKGTRLVFWNPRKDDGDALLVAHTLGMQVTIEPECQRSVASSRHGVSHYEFWAAHSSPMEATRYAIFKVAEDITCPNF